MDKYQAALNYLYSLVDYSLTKNLRYSPEKFNLERMNSFMMRLDNPQFNYPVIHVAGTKGKGSTCALISNALLMAKYKVGFYSSPHLSDYTERIRINNKYISRREFTRIIEIMKPVIESIPEISTFEITTAIAFLYFSFQKIDIAVVEVGLGGRLDATNIVFPLISVITSISKDHTKILGKTLEKIATEKAGIIKKNTPVIIAPQNKKVLDLLIQNAKEKKSHFIDVSKQYKYEIISFSLEKQIFWISNDQKKLRIELPLLGLHQIENAMTSIAALDQINELGWHISDKNIQAGFSKVKWPGRFEVISRRPMVIVDSAHNVDSVRKLLRTINTYLINKKIILIFGASEDKDIQGMLKILKPRMGKIILTNSEHPRAIPVEKLLHIIDDKSTNIEGSPSIKVAIKLALKYYDDDSVIIGAGSIFLASAIRDIWKKGSK